jgi:hypothetical protein
VQYDRHHAAENCPRRAFAQSILRTWLETIDEDARRAKPGQSDIRRVADPKHRIQGKLLEIEASRGDVLAKISGLVRERAGTVISNTRANRGTAYLFSFAPSGAQPFS